LPLTIELAAAHSKLFSPQALLKRLDDRLALLTGGARDLPERQQTMRGTIAWSYNLLSTGEQLLFRRLAAFVGGCTLEAAEGVCNADGDLPLAMLDGLGSLLDQSMLRQQAEADGEPRFVMLETIREYALGRLQASGQAEDLRHQHAQYYLALAVAAEPELRGPRQVTWFNQLEAEHNNLRAALRWYMAGGAAQQFVQLAGALFWFWASHGHVSEGHAWLEQALIQSSELPLPVCAKALLVAGQMLSLRGNYERAQQLSGKSLALYRSFGDRSGTASALAVLGWAAYLQGNVAWANAQLDEGLALCREHGDQQGMADVLGYIAQILWRQGDLATAMARYQERLR
jgi:tetratricopeptide (TPR) repeat protein